MARRWVPPAFCQGFDCPQYEVLERAADYELRRYTPSRWVTCETRARSYDDAARAVGGTAFNSLFQYISGNNVAGQKIDMTVPVLMRVVPNQGSSSVAMSFYVSPDVAAPQAVDHSVQLTQLPALTVYVRSFGGFMDPAEASRQASVLAQSIGDPSKFDGRYYYSAAYDSPFRANNRHNEVWFVKT